MSDKPDIHDHTLVWMTHPDCEEAAVWPRSYLAVNPSWCELKKPEQSKKVQRARDAAPITSEPVATEETK